MCHLGHRPDRQLYNLTTNINPDPAWKTGREEGSEMTSKRTYEDNAEFGAKGGETTKARHGVDHYKKIGKAGASKGGRATLERHGSDYFRQLALKRHQKNKANADESEK